MCGLFSSKTIFLCSNERCQKKNEEIYEHIKGVLEEKGLSGEIKLAWSLCMRMCGAGPNVMVLPEGEIHSQMTKEKAEQIVADLAG